MALFNVQLCGARDGSSVIVDFLALTPTTGEVYSLDDGINPLVCGTVINEASAGVAAYTADTLYLSCIDCITGTSKENYFQFINCNTRASLAISPIDFGFLPGNIEVYEITYIKDVPTTECFYFNQVVYPDAPVTISTFVSAVQYASCVLCNWETNSVVVEVSECFTENVYYVQVPNTAGPVISFIPDGNLEQLCGIIGVTADTPTTATYLSSFGDCAECTGQTFNKREIINCVTGEIDVIFASVLYGVGDSGYVTIIDPSEGDSNCYRIGEETESGVTITTYLDYQSSEGCDECIACNGYGILFYQCSDESQSIYSGLSYQYIMIGQTFLHPVLGCCFVDGYYDPSLGNDETLWSFYEFTGCTECESTHDNYQSWYAQSCGDDGFEFSGAISLPTGFSAGDTITVKFGLYNYICVTLLYPFGEDRYNAIAISDGTTYTDCPTCSNQQYIGVTIVNCKTFEQQNVLMFQWAYNMILENGPFFNDFYQNCYYIFGDCLKDESLPLFVPGLIYTSCEDCHAPKNANTPSTVCEICCDCGATGSTVNIITPPYPVWTDQYGKAVVQTNMIVIGGNGLNG
jgi:hypothetical protein